MCGCIIGDSLPKKIKHAKTKYESVYMNNILPKHDVQNKIIRKGLSEVVEG